MRRLLEDHEDLMVQRFFFDPAFREATRLRQAFVRKALAQDPRFLKTQEEADWIFILKREYNYAVVLKSAVWAVLPFLLANAAGVLVCKRLTLPPLVVAPAAFYGFRHFFFVKHSKRLFDMANIGEEYELGAERNSVLRRCNALLGVEDF